MTIIAEGRVAMFIWFLIACVGGIYYTMKAYQGQEIKLRDSPMLAKIDEGIDRCVELGAPVVVSAGDAAYLSGMYAPMTIAGMNVMRHTTRLAVARGVQPIIQCPGQMDAVPLIDGIYREVCMAEGKPEAYDRTNIRYYGADYKSYMLVLPLM
jgi:hypothetical protein